MFVAPRELQLEVERTYSKQHVKKILKDFISSSVDLESLVSSTVLALHDYRTKEYSYASKNKRMKHIQTLDLRDLVIDILAVVLPMQQPEPMTSLTGRLAGYLGFEHHLDAIKTTAEIAAVCAINDLFDVFKKNDQLHIMTRLKLPQEVEAFLLRTKYLPPMVCKPNVLKKNWDSGYLTVNDHVILKKHNQHDQNVCLDSLNKFNHVALSLNEELLRHYEELPKKELDTPDKEKAYAKFKKESLQVYVDLVLQGNEFYLTHKVDKRGRTYAQGYHVNYQGSSFKKAIIQFANKQKLKGMP